MQTHKAGVVYWCVLAAAFTAVAAHVDTLSLTSAVLGRTVNYIVIRPAHYEASVRANTPLPVLYLLHCAGCTHLSWLDRYYCDGLTELIDSVHLIAVCPFDGTSQSWWLDSPVRSDSRMTTFLIEELKPRIDSLYYTCRERENTALGGHSMGGFGALHNAMYHPEIFGIAVGIKSGIDLLNPSWPSDFGLSAVLGSPAQYPQHWVWASVIPNAAKFKDAHLRMLLFNGLNDDWFAAENRRFHDTLASLGVSHDYREINETHFQVTRGVVKAMLAFCDTVSRCGGLKTHRRPPQHNRTAPGDGTRYALFLEDKHVTERLMRKGGLVDWRGRPCCGTNAAAVPPSGVYFFITHDTYGNTLITQPAVIF